MEIRHLFQFVTGSFETDTGKLICVPHRKYLRVDLCFQGPMHNPFARIVLHSKDLAKDAEQVFESAAALGNEIARRWNAQMPADPVKAERAIVCCFCGHDLAYPGAEPTEELLKQAYEHEAICEKNPYLARIAELEAALANTLKLSPPKRKHLTIALNLELRTTVSGTECGVALNEMFRELTGRDHEKHHELK